MCAHTCAHKKLPRRSARRAKPESAQTGHFGITEGAFLVKQLPWTLELLRICLPRKQEHALSGRVRVQDTNY